MAQELCKWEIGACSETGYVRTENEDRMSSIRIGRDRLYLVVDGMGGHKAGARAAELTVQGLEAGMTQFLSERSTNDAITAAFATANQIVYEQAHSEDTTTSGMGATAVMLLTQDSLTYIAHVGDSRAYLFAKGKLQRLTKDHSPVERMVTAGILTPAEARIHPQVNVIDRAMGHKPQLDVEIAQPFKLEEGDGILLCSDGLSGYVDDADIELVIRRSVKAQEIADKLVQEALKAGGGDNVTVQFIRRSRLDSEVKQSGFALWLESLWQFKLIMAIIVTLMLIVAYEMAVLFKRSSEPEANAFVSESVHSDLNKNTQQHQHTVHMPPVHNEPNNQIETVQEEMKGLKADLENLKQKSTDTQMEAINMEIKRLQKELVTAQQEIAAIKLKYARVKQKSRRKIQANAPKQVTTINASKPRLF